MLRPKCESSLHLKTLAHPSSVRVKLSAVSVFPKLNSPQWLHQRTIHSVVLCQIEDPDKAAIRKVSQIQVICEPKKREASTLLPQITLALPFHSCQVDKSLAIGASERELD